MSCTHQEAISPCPRRLTVSCFALTFGVLCPVATTAVHAQPSVESELRSALAALPHPETRVGACVIDLDTGTTAFSRNADTPLIPASSMKVFVMAAALKELGPNFAFQTTFATDGRNLFVIGDGDPAFGDEKVHRSRNEPITADFERWADALVGKSMATVLGDLVIDESIFDNQWVHPSWDKSDLDNWYAAPVAGLNFNGNCIDITISPAGKRGAPALVFFQPNNTLVKIINKCRTGGDGTPVLHHAHDTFEYRLSGGVNKRWPFGSVSFPDPGLLFADSLRIVLTKRGITIGGTIRRERIHQPDGSLPASLTILSMRTTPLADVLRRIGKDSQALFAECLLKRIGYAWAKRQGRSDPQGSWALGREAIMEFVERAGIDPVGLVVSDGSGLSRDNRCTARQLAELLAWMHRQGVADLLYQSLSVAGVDGTLRKRLKDIPGRVHAKTGTMHRVRTLTGYVGGQAFQPVSRPTGKSVPQDFDPRYAFAVLFNGYKGPSTPYKEIQDRICRILADAARHQTDGE